MDQSTVGMKLTNHRCKQANSKDREIIDTCSGSQAELNNYNIWVGKAMNFLYASFMGRKKSKVY